MLVPISLPLDHDGFLRRECPHCLRQFKWHDGPANDEAEQQPTPTTYYCPLCGEPAKPDSWWTQEQLDYAQGVAVPRAVRELAHGLKDSLESANSRFLRISVNEQVDLPEAPVPLSEPDDMVIVASPCHPYEPIKVIEGATDVLHCLLCGEAFSL